MFRKIIWAFLELLTIGSGTFIFTSSIVVDPDYLDPELVGTGAFLIVLGLLFRNWRMTLFVSSDGAKPNKTEISSRSANTILIVVLSVAIFLLNRKAIATNLNVLFVESQLEELETKTNDLQDLEGNFNGLQDRVEFLEYQVSDLDADAHRHY